MQISSIFNHFYISLLIQVSRPTTIKPIARVKDKVSAIINVDDDDDQTTQANKKGQQRGNSKPSLSKFFSSPRPIRTITSNLMPGLPTIKKLVAECTQKTVAASNQLPTRPVIKMIVPPVKPLVGPSKIIVSTNGPEAQQQHDVMRPDMELIRLSNYLTPATRKLINKLKYFQLYNGDVYTVNIGPYTPAKVSRDTKTCRCGDLMLFRFVEKTVQHCLH